jgi:hypothetical protein
VSFLLFEEIKDGLAHGSHRVSSVENVDDDIGRIEDLVELSPNSTRRSLGVDSLSGFISRVIGVGSDGELLQSLICETVHKGRVVSSARGIGL